MQHRRCANTSAHPCTTNRHRSAYTSIASDLATLVYTHAYTYRPYTRAYAGRHPTGSHTHANIEGTDGDAHPNACRRCTSAQQCT